MVIRITYIVRQQYRITRNFHRNTQTDRDIIAIGLFSDHYIRLFHIVSSCNIDIWIIFFIDFFPIRKNIIAISSKILRNLHPLQIKGKDIRLGIDRNSLFLNIVPALNQFFLLH